MYKINYKAVVFAFILQMLVGVLWYASTPIEFLGRLSSEQGTSIPSVAVMTVFPLSVIAYLMFIAWLLVKAKGLSGIGRFSLVVGTWLFIFFPNAVFVSLHLDLNQIEVFYLLSFGIVNCLIAAIILPLWQPSRSIFRG